MAKFIVTGDWHFRGVNPRARVDNFKESLIRKIHDVYALARKHQADAIIVPGDLFDSPGTAWGTAAELAVLLKAAPCPVLTIPGNHDLWAGNPGSKHRTPYGFLAALGIINDLSSNGYVDSHIYPTLVTGHGFTIETDTANGKGQFTPSGEYTQSYFHIHVVHSMLMDQSPGFDMRHTLISQVETTAQVIISGHEHIGFGIKRRDDGVLFINPGALARLSAHHAEIERQIHVALLTVENGKADAELIPIKAALPGHEVLSREHLEAEASRNEMLERFLALLSSEGESKFLEVREIIEDISLRENIPAEVKADALRRIGAAREELGVA